MRVALSGRSEAPIGPYAPFLPPVLRLMRPGVFVLSPTDVLLMPSISGVGAPEFLYVNLLVVPLTFQPTFCRTSYAPPGSVASKMYEPSCFWSSRRTPFRSQRIVGVCG